MSDNPNDRPPDEGPELAPAPEPVADTPAPETPSPEPTEPAAAAPEPTPEPEPAKPSQSDRRFARITARAQETQAQLDQARRELAAAQALLAGRTEGEPAPQPPTLRIDPAAVDQAARQLLAERDFAARRTALIQEGTKEFTEAEWNAKTGILGDLGAYETPAFMQALVEIPGAHRVVAALADDADRFVALLDKSPVAMAAELGRMAAELNAPKPAKPISQAPAPVAPVGAGQPRGEVDIYDPKMTQEEYNAFRRKTAPISLGGEGRRVS